jgi:hypothetical protein
MSNKSNWNIEPKDTKANNQEELISNWPWEYPTYIKASNKEGELTSTNRFLGLIVCMNQVYINQMWRCFEERRISFTYRSEFEKRIKDLPEELQAIIFSKVWNKGKDTLWECMLGTTKQSGYHYNLEGFFYDLYYTRVMVPATINDSLV